jgi:NAD(P)-dependent dehydrogenase (short-subunit alcohol dehydrogenase family)
VTRAAFVEKVPTAAEMPEHFYKTFNINARGVFFTVQEGSPLIRNGGSIVLVTSSTYLKGIAF